MKSKLLLLLLSRRDTSGFAIVIALTMGLIMVLVGISLLVRSTNQHTHAGASQVTTEGISMTEVGITRLQNFLNDNRFLALYDDCTARSSADNTCPDSPPGPSDPSPSELTWANLTADELANTASACQSTEISNFERLVRNGEWIDVEEASHQRQYRLLSYRYEKEDPSQDDYTAPGIGILTLEGRVKQNNDLKVATSRIEVKIPIKETAPDSEAVPGVWLTEGGTGNNTIQADVLLNDCDTSLTDITITGTDPDTGEAYGAKHTTMAFPDLNTIMPIPDVSDPSATAVDLSFDMDAGEDIDDVYFSDLATSPARTYRFPRRDASDNLVDTPRIVTLKDADGNPLLDTYGNPVTVEVYEYVFDHLDTPTSSDEIQIEPGKRVTFYVKGDVIKGADFVHSCTDSFGNLIENTDSAGNTETDADGNPILCQPTNFQILGYGTLAPTDGVKNKICTNGSDLMDTFIFAPTYKVGVAGGGNGGGYKGTVWADTWTNGENCGSQTSNTVVEQTARWEDLFMLGFIPTNMPPKLSGTSGWQRLERD